MEALEFWNEQAGKGNQSGSRDVIAAELERRAILAHLADGLRVLDVGCGTGETAIAAARQYDLDITGWDYAANMVAQANANLQQAGELRGRVRFAQADIRQLAPAGRYDVIYTQRCIINLGGWDEQQAAIRALLTMLVPRGQYLMCECSADGLAELNRWRSALGLEPITAPWHNRYLQDNEVEALADDVNRADLAGLKSVKAPLSTYAFLSRIVNAWEAQQRGEPPAYTAPVNQLALQLPSMGMFGQNRLWRWRRW